MKILFYTFLCLLFLLSGHPVLASTEQRILSVPAAMERDMKSLVHYLTDSESDKYAQAKSIAMWIATHIAYDNYTYAVGVGKDSGYKSSSRLKQGAQDADTVFKTRIGTCEGISDLYGKMLSLAGIKSQKIQGFVLTGASSLADAKHRIRSESVGHVWNKIHLSDKDILVDVTWMAQGQAGQGSQRLTTYQKNNELRQIARKRPTYGYRSDYFDFEYKDRQKKGEYRFDQHKKLLAR